MRPLRFCGTLNHMNMPERTCETCTYYRCEALGDYGSGPIELGCRLYDTEPERFKRDPEDDPHFPYDPAPDCYEVEFWCTDFAEDVDGSDASFDAAYQRFRDFLDKGHPL